MSQSEVMMMLIRDVGMTMLVSECGLLPYSSEKASLASTARCLATRLVSAGGVR